MAFFEAVIGRIIHNNGNGRQKIPDAKTIFIDEGLQGEELAEDFAQVDLPVAIFRNLSRIDYGLEASSIQLSDEAVKPDAVSRIGNFVNSVFIVFSRLTPPKKMDLDVREFSRDGGKELEEFLGLRNHGMNSTNGNSLIPRLDASLVDPSKEQVLVDFIK